MARPHGVEDGCFVQGALRVDPCAGVAQGPGMDRCGRRDGMAVAASHRRHALAVAKPALPEVERLGVGEAPRALPRFDDAIAAHAFVLPRIASLRVVRREEAALSVDELQHPLHPGIVRAAEVDPASRAPDVGVAPGRRDLFAGDEEQVVAYGPFPDLLEVGAGVVVGDREEVEADAARFHHVLIDRVVAVAVDGVGVEVAAIPAAAA